MKPKGVVAGEVIQDVLNQPGCLGLLKNCENKSCGFRKDCKETMEKLFPKPEKENYKKQTFIFLEILKHKFLLFIGFFKKLFTPDYWANALMGFDNLLFVVLVDGLILALLVSCTFSIYFLYKRDWIMSLCSVAVFVAIGAISNFVDNGSEKKVGDQ